MIVYSASWCGACEGLKAQLKQAGIEYEERSLDDDEVILEAQKLRVRSLPAVRIPGEDVTLSTSFLGSVKDFIRTKPHFAS